MIPEVLRLERVSSKMSGMLMLDNVEMSIARGEIVGLQTIDSYGLSELLKVLLFNQPIYYGYVYFQEKKVNSWQEMHRTANNIAVIGPRNSLVPGQNVMTNIFVLRRGFRQEILNEKLLRSQLQPFFDEIGVDIDPYLYVEQLTPFERVLTELLRAVVAGYHLVILREIGSIISEDELATFQSIVRYYASKGMSFLYISPHFEELSMIAGRVMFFIEGTIVAETRLDEGEGSLEDKTKAVAKSFAEGYHKRILEHIRSRENKDWEEDKSEETILQIRNLTGEQLSGFNLDIYKNECLVIQCLDMKVYADLVDYVSNIGGREIAVISERPGKLMTFSTMDYLDNLCFTSDQKVHGFWMHKKYRESIRREFTPMLGEEVFDKQINELTTMEKYELVYARILLQHPKVVFIIQPFKGADLRLRQRIWELQETLMSKGITIVMIAVNMADCLSLATRVLRINSKAEVDEYLPDIFSELPLTIPLISLYEETSDE